MDTIEITNTFNNMAFPILIACTLSGLIMYLLITINIANDYKKKLQKAERLIQEGHSKALSGRKNDGFYNERRRLREDK